MVLFGINYYHRKGYKRVQNTCSQYKFPENAEGIDVRSQRVDQFYATIFSNGKDYQDLWFVTKKVLIWSHGCGQVETRFSVNADLVNKNMKQESIDEQSVVSLWWISVRGWNFKSK